MSLSSGHRPIVVGVFVFSSSWHPENWIFLGHTFVWSAAVILRQSMEMNSLNWPPDGPRNVLWSSEIMGGLTGSRKGDFQSNK